MSVFTYKLVETNDLPLIHGWLKQPHNAEWIHGEGLQNTLTGLENFVAGKSSKTKLWIAEVDGKPFAFLMSRPVDQTNADFSNVEFVGPNAISMDIFIGDANMTGKGFGTKLIKDFLVTNFPEATDFIIDPEASNLRAIHVYQKVGFRIVNEFIAPWHPVKHYLMHVSRNTLENL